MMLDQVETLRTLAGGLAKAGSKHDRATILIHEAIRLGIDTGPEIIAALHDLGFNRRHVGILLANQTGPFPESHHWYRDDDGRYRSHPLK